MLAMTLAIGGWAEAVENACPVGGISTVPGLAAAIGANSYSNNACDLIIDETIPVTVISLGITARSITISGPVSIINDTSPASEVRLTAAGPGALGFIVINQGIVKAHKLLNLTATGDITVSGSQLIAASIFGPPPSGTGDLRINAGGNLDIQGTSVFGGSILEFVVDGSITFICEGDGNGCQDPLLSSKAVELCGTCPPGDTCPPDPRVPPAVFPCTVNFPTDQDLREVCFPSGDQPDCGGGGKECRFLARNGDIDIHGTTLICTKHISFAADNGNLLGAGATVTSTTDRIAFVIHGTVDLEGATLTAVNDTILIRSTLCPAAPAVCVDLDLSTVTAKNIVVATPGSDGIISLCGATHQDIGADEPTYNGDSTPPYNGTVLDEAPAECAAPLTLIP
jgi:hypothetical protein